MVIREVMHASLFPCRLKLSQSPMQCLSGGGWEMHVRDIFKKLIQIIKHLPFRQVANESVDVTKHTAVVRLCVRLDMRPARAG